MREFLLTIVTAFVAQISLGQSQIGDVFSDYEWVKVVAADSKEIDYTEQLSIWARTELNVLPYTVQRPSDVGVHYDHKPEDIIWVIKGEVVEFLTTQNASKFFASQMYAAKLSVTIEEFLTWKRNQGQKISVKVTPQSTSSGSAVSNAPGKESTSVTSKTPVREVSTVESPAVSVGQASCVLVDRGQGCFVTNHHVIDGASEIFVATDLQNFMPARVLKSSRELDLAIVKLTNPDDISFVSAFDNAVLRVNAQKGEEVRAVGYPKAIDLGFDSKITAGIISGTSFMENPAMYQIDASITSGSSGGALFDMSGYLVGITASGYRPDIHTENVNGAVKGYHVLELASQTPCNVSQSTSAQNFDANVAQQSNSQVFPVLTKKTTN